MKRGVELIISLLRDANIPSGDPFMGVKLAAGFLLAAGIAILIWKRKKI